MTDKKVLLIECTDEELDEEATERGYALIERGSVQNEPDSEFDINDLEELVSAILDGRMQDAMDIIEGMSEGEINIPSLVACHKAISRS